MATSTSKNRSSAKAGTQNDSATVEVTPVSAWKKNKAEKTLTLPSGAVVKARRTSFQAFLKAGIIPNSLMSLVQDALKKGKRPEVEVSVDDISQIDSFIEMVDNVVLFVLQTPKPQPVPENEDDRDEELLYIDEIDDEDKMFVFQWATGGTTDVEQFRKDAGDLLVAVRAGEELEDETE